MSSHSTDFQGSVIDALREAIERCTHVTKKATSNNVH